MEDRDREESREAEKERRRVEAQDEKETARDKRVDFAHALSSPYVGFA